MFYKSARVEYVPLGVIGAIVPWNYPFHNVFNPLVAALYAGNAIIIKVLNLIVFCDDCSCQICIRYGKGRKGEGGGFLLRIC